MGCCVSTNTIDTSLFTKCDPESWTQDTVLMWLKYSCDGELSDLIKPFREHRICGLTFIKLTIEDLENDLLIKQIGLREQFIYQRNKTIQNYNKAPLKISCNIDVKLPKLPKYHAMIPSDTHSNLYIQSMQKLDKIDQVTYSPEVLDDNILNKNETKYEHKNDETYNEKCKLLLPGFIREIESNIFNNIRIIPIEINNICFQYLYEDEKNIHEIGRDIFVLMSNSCDKYKTVNKQELMNYIEDILNMKYKENKNVNAIFNDLIRYEYIDKTENEEIEEYEFKQMKHREFVGEFEPDRRGWTQQTQIEVYSHTFNKWELGTIHSIESNHNDILLIDYGTPTQQMRKYVDRYDNDTVRSTEKFINDRTSWDKYSKIEIYVNQHDGVWYPAMVLDVFTSIQIIKVYYKDNDGTEYNKFFDLWSPSLRQPQPTNNNQYKVNTKVRVWSNGKKMWISGIIVQYIQEIDAVKVVYDRYEKLLSVHSNDIKLIN